MQAQKRCVSERILNLPPNHTDNDLADSLALRFRQHGFDNPTDIVGTKGVSKINLSPRRDLMTIADENGIGNDVSPDFYERYEQAFVKELSVFADCVLDDKELPYELDVAVKGMEIAEALQESPRTGKKIEWDEHGVRRSA